MDTNTTLTTFADFFRDRGHEPIESAALIPVGADPTLFTTAGMQQLTPFLLGEPHPQGRRLTGVQRCLRTTDLEEVGDYCHLTAFQMLGSWSLGDYDGPQSQRWGLELLTEGLGVDPGRLHATAFGGDGQVGPDTAAAATWQELGLPVELLGEDNWWSNGLTGPCGPDAELFVWTGGGRPAGTPGTDDRWLELWNHVTMRYLRRPDGSLEPLPQCSVDTGMGLERLMMVLQHTGSVYETDLFAPWTRVVPRLWPGEQHSVRVVMDHLRSALVVIGDGVRPSNTGRGYVLRRLVRRALTQLWRTDDSRTLADLPLQVVQHTLARFGQPEDPGAVRDVLLAEERRFGALMSRGRSVLRRLYPDGRLTESDYRYLHETHGLPRELMTALASDLTG
jgi:alanyl-tRNA synthetase